MGNETNDKSKIHSFLLEYNTIGIQKWTEISSSEG